MINEYDEMEISVNESERDVLYEVLSAEYQKTRTEYKLALHEWYARPNGATDAVCSGWSERLTDIENLLEALGFEIDYQYSVVKYKAASDGSA